MNEVSPARIFSKPCPCKFERLMTILLVMILLTAIWQLGHPAPVVASTLFQSEERLVSEPTPSPSFEGAESTPRTSPVIGILVLLAPLVFIAWRSWGVKEPKITASCCAPVIDENKRPFQIQEDQADSVDPPRP